MRSDKICRTEQIQEMTSQVLDVCIVGGGINGAATAACLSAHGFKVGLIEANDFASMTSQSSSNMIWGGIKYLENGEFSLVRNLCQSRNRLIKNYPANIPETRFRVFMKKKQKTPSWMFRLGSWLYWFIGDCQTKKPKYFNQKQLQEMPCSDDFNGAVEYSDAILPENDARLTFSFIRSTWENGSLAVNYCKAQQLTKKEGLWHIEIEDKISLKSQFIKAKILINATGPNAVLFNQRQQLPAKHQLYFSKGVHLIVPAIGNGERVLSFVSDDQRLFFALPMGSRTCIGTTDTRVNSFNCQVTDEDRDFILQNINDRLKLDKPLTRDDIIAERCGVRPLVTEASSDGAEEDWLKLSRKHIIEVAKEEKLITLLGGKITDCLNVGEEVLHEIKQLIDSKIDSIKWFGEENDQARQSFLSKFPPLVPPEKAQQLWRRFGSRGQTIIDTIKKSPEQLQELCPGADVCIAEFHYMAKYEMVCFPEDILRRRSKTALTAKTSDMHASVTIADLCTQYFSL
jgi:glycerol-3-phosphate dehydrogenase